MAENEPAKITNRNRKPTQDPAIQEIVNNVDPIVEEPKIEDEEIIPEEEKPVEPVVEAPKTPIVEEKPVETPKEPEIDYREKFKASSQEALALHFKNEKLVDTIDEAEAMPEPTEDEVRAYALSKGAEYDELDDLTKGVLKDTLWTNKRFNKISEANKEAKNIKDWVAKVDHFVDTPEAVNKYPELLDNAEDFRAFAIKPSRRGMDLEDLATAFLYGLAQTPVKRNKGASLNESHGGGAEPKPQGITEDQARSIRVNDPKEYRRLIKEGKIKIEI